MKISSNILPDIEYKCRNRSKNVVPGDLKIEFNFRFSPEITEDEIKAEVVKVIEENIKN